MIQVITEIRNDVWQHFVSHPFDYLLYILLALAVGSFVFTNKYVDRHSDYDMQVNLARISALIVFVSCVMFAVYG